MTSPARSEYTTKLLTAETWPDFAALVEANNGVWGGCWCMGFHPEGIPTDATAEGNRKAKRAHVEDRTVHQVLVYRDGECVGWTQYGPPAEVATIKNAKAYEKDRVILPDWRIGCVFTGSKHRRTGVARAGLAGALEAIAQAGGGTVEAYPEQVERRPEQRGAYLHTGPEDLFEEFGFVRDRRIAKWRWVMRTTVQAPDVTEQVRAICLRLPGATERLSHGSPAFFVTKQFVMLWPQGHHEHEFPHLWCAAPPGAQEELVAAAPDRFFRPPYVGGRGWVGMRLDGDVDWSEVTELCLDAYRVIAPKRLVAQVDTR